MASGVRAGKADNEDTEDEPPATVVTRRRACSNMQGCTCQNCILARWESFGHRTDVFGRRVARRSTPSSRSSNGGSQPFSLNLCRELQEYSGPLGGPAVTIEIAHGDDPSGSTSQSLSVGDLKLSVSIDHATPDGAMPERCFNISKRRSFGDEVVYLSRAPSPYRKASAGRTSALLDNAAACHAQRRDTGASERGDPAAVAELLRQTARSCYNTTPRTLIDALRAVGPPEMSACLAELQC